jgi:prepilin-type N-terminal cleavage/methylation domain-containing protein
VHFSSSVHRRRRRGFTIAECLVAVTLFAVGLLGLSGTALAVQRIGTDGARRAEGAALAVARLERLAATACAARAAGSAVTNGISEAWTVASAGGVTIAVDSLRLPPASGRPALTFAVGSALPC